MRLIGYIIDDVKYWVATDRFDLTAKDIALIYKLRGEIEKFFAWWKTPPQSVSPHCTQQTWADGADPVRIKTYLLLAICFIKTAILCRAVLE